jgi:hypothetical protein
MALSFLGGLDSRSLWLLAAVALCMWVSLTKRISLGQLADGAVGPVLSFGNFLIARLALSAGRVTGAKE